MLLVYDVADAASFASLGGWLEEALKDNKVPVAVCANKVSGNLRLSLDSIEPDRRTHDSIEGGWGKAQSR